jgi:hypothetical protein
MDGFHLPATSLSEADPLRPPRVTTCQQGGAMPLAGGMSVRP